MCLPAYARFLEGCVNTDEGDTNFYAFGGTKAIGGRILHVVEQALNRASREVHAGFTGGVVAEHGSVVLGDQAVTKNNKTT